jgi:chloramphenicol 3-O phosphotransferase
MSAGQIIFLNGASSSGKTAVARALQHILEEPYLLIGVDDAFRMLPERFRDWESPDNH